MRHEKKFNPVPPFQDLKKIIPTPLGKKKSFSPKTFFTSPPPLWQY